ncbi:hypothetical protein SLA2020_197020 [Shorea laevis]
MEKFLHGVAKEKLVRFTAQQLCALISRAITRPDFGFTLSFVSSPSNLIKYSRKQSREVGFLFFTIVSSDSRTTTMNNEYSLADVGLHASLLYYLKARFHFNKDQFADLMVISGIAGTISQMLLMPILAPAIGEDRLLSIGLFFASAHVPYVAAMFSIFFVFSQPCIRSIVSRQVGSCEQVFVVDQTLFWQHTGIDFFNIIFVSGKAQGIITGIGLLFMDSEMMGLAHVWLRPMGLELLFNGSS